MGFSKKLFLSKDLENETPLRTKEELAPLEEWWNRRRKCNEVNYMITGLLLPFWQEMSSKTGEMRRIWALTNCSAACGIILLCACERRSARLPVHVFVCLRARTHARSLACAHERNKFHRQIIGESGGQNLVRRAANV